MRDVVFACLPVGRFLLVSLTEKNDKDKKSDFACSWVRNSIFAGYQGSA